MQVRHFISEIFKDDPISYIEKNSFRKMNEVLTLQPEDDFPRYQKALIA